MNKKITVRNIPGKAHQRLVKIAKKHGQSLNELIVFWLKKIPEYYGPKKK